MAKSKTSKHVVSPGEEVVQLSRPYVVEDYKDIACAVARGVMANPARKDIGCGDRNADHRAARQIRAAARIIYEEIVEEMEQMEVR